MKTPTFLRIIALTLTLGLATTGFSADKKPQASPSKVDSSQTKAAKVDLNTANSETLQTLPGIGPSTAEAIIAARPFKSVSDLEQVRGIGPKKMKDLHDKVRVSQASTTTKPAATASKPAASPSDTTTTQRKPSTTTAERSTSTTSSKPLPSSSTGQARDEKGRFVGKINLNTATQAELESLPEIGPEKAHAIIEARPFKSIEDVMKVKGIKEGTFEVIKDQITVK